MRQRLGGQHVLDLAGADAEGQRTERAVRRRVRVAAHDGHAGLGQTELRADDVHDALVDVAHREVRMPNSAQFSRSVSTWVRLRDRRWAVDVDRGDVVVLRGHVRSGRRTAAASRSPSNACGLVTSCTRCRSM
jgi:hypothetical protein